MKYQANPVIVDAYRITEVHEGTKKNPYWIELENGQKVIATPDMVSRMTPAVDDYWVIQSDGYIYLNPKLVFERKYSPVSK